MAYQDDKAWWDTDAKEDKEHFIGKVMERAKSLHDTLINFRQDAIRYFEQTEYKNYADNNERKLFEDLANEEQITQHPYLTLNVTASCVETACNKIAKSKPKVTFVTKSASRERREIASRLDKWILQVFKGGKIWKFASRAFKSACVTGLGIIKVVIMKGKIKFYKIPVFEFFCDNSLTGDDKPTEAGEIKAVDFYKLVEIFPDKKDELIDMYGRDKMIMVTEIYKAYKRQVITTEKVLLSDNKWDKPLPYKFQNWETADQGVISIGIAKKLQSIHSAITYILQKTFQSIRNFAVPRIFISQGSQPKTHEIANVTAQIIEVSTEDGKVPQFSTPQAMDNQVIEMMILLWQKAFEILGISEMSAGGKIPRGLEKASGTALRSYQQIESERFQLIRSNYEEFFVDLTKLIFKLVPDDMLPDGVKRKDIEDLKEDCTIWTSSLLPEEPAGKLAMVTDLFNTGLVAQAEALDLLDSPDVNAYTKSQTARLRAIDLVIDRALEKNETPVFHPSLGLELFLDRARKKYAQIIIDEPDETDKLDRLGAFVTELEGKSAQVTGLNQALQANAQQAGAGAGGAYPQQAQPDVERRIDIRAQG